MNTEIEFVLDAAMLNELDELADIRGVTRNSLLFQYIAYGMWAMKSTARTVASRPPEKNLPPHAALWPFPRIRRDGGWIVIPKRKRK